jgi:hypothetical protein
MAATNEHDPAGEVNLVHRRGDTFTRTVTLTTDGTAVNLTNSSAVFTISDTDATTQTLVQLTVGSGITMGGTAGTIAITATPTQMNFNSGVYAYALTWLQNSTTTTLIAGQFQNI